VQLKDPNSVAAIVDALRQLHGDAFARYMLRQGMTLAALKDALSRSRLKNRDAVKLMTSALRSGDFVVKPEIAAPSHLVFIYDPPKSLHVVDIAIETEGHTVASADIWLRLAD
jgi:hypothetical protein